MRDLVLSSLVFLVVVLSGCATGVPAAKGGESWSIDAELVECCCCDAICPCLVGSKPTRGFCQGHRLVVIENGHFGDVDLDGISAVITFQIGKWSKLWVDEHATDAQVAAVRQLLERQWASLFRNVLEVERVPITYTKTPTTIAFSIPAGDVEIEQLTGAGDRVIEVRNLKAFRDYVQYKSKVLNHTSDDAAQRFEFSGTNGFSARHAASS